MKILGFRALFVLMSAAMLLSACGNSTSAPTETMQEGHASYEEYSPERFAELKGSQKFVLFFHADWCPLCVRLEGLIKEDLASLGPAIILETNFDRERQVKKEYKVMNQTTVLFFDEQGEVVKNKVNPSVDEIRDFFAE